jgi:hypothetical protein
MKDHSTPQQLLTRLAQHRQRVAELDPQVVQAAHYPRQDNNELTRAVEDLYKDLSTYWTPEDG